MSLTPLLRLNLIAFDTRPWDTLMNGNMSIIDALLSRYLNLPNLQGVWTNTTVYSINNVVIDPTDSTIWQCAANHVSAASPTTFAQDRALHSNYWTALPTLQTLQTLTGAASGMRNAIINGDMGIWQRNTTLTSTFTGNILSPADRWTHYLQGTGGSMTISRQTVTQQSVIDAGLYNWMELNLTAAPTGPPLLVDTYQRIEGAGTFANQQVTLSFWAYASTLLSAQVFFSQRFGTGGSPSADVPTGFNNFTVGITPQKYSFTVSLPSIFGKVFGTNNDDSLQACIRLLPDPDLSSPFQLFITGVQLEPGGVATSFELRRRHTELSLCQRYYQTLQGTLTGYAPNPGATHYSTMPLTVTMRAAPTVSVTPSGGSNYNSVTPTSSASSVVLTAIATATGALAYNFILTSNAELFP